MSQPMLKRGTVHKEALRIAGEKVYRDRTIEVTYPYTGEVIATVPKATLEDVRLAYRIARIRIL
jgi:acyl-CoA reductase-like NAD-dependent aldehyde dehydrogenase